ncbi:MAG TPA: DUF2339 domain-containing protein [Casimicrobiaceae bacterium]|nr:DUF2339 domain-containing protein [Casimicrobiaceae bacterium]
MGWLGFLLGALVGAYVHGFPGLVAGAVVGTLAGLAWRRLEGTTAAWPRAEGALERRLREVERRLSALESARGEGGSAIAAAASTPPPASETAAEVVRPPETPAASTEDVAVAPPSLHPVRKGGAGDAGAAAVERPAAAAPPPQPAARNPLWAWFIGGNAMVRVGVVVLFFGTAFLLLYFTEHVTIPIEFQFLGVAAVGFALIAVGHRLRRTRATYALSLVGGGLGVLYLTTFAALQLVPLLAPATAFLLLAAIAALAVGLSLAFDAQPLAALAALGGLLAPVLVPTVSEPLLLFGYVAVVNLIVLGVAWFRAWRALDLVGFVGTFVLGLWWGHEYYRPEYFATVEPLLVAFFIAYLALPIVHTLRGVGERRLDAVLIFGVPMVGFGLQAALVHDMRYGLAWSAAALAALYALLWRSMRTRGESAQALATAHGALAAIFATLVAPFAVDARWTSATWAVEAASVYWVGCHERRPLARWFALALQLATGLAFLVGGFDEYAELAFVNRQFLGIAAIALSAFATVRIGDARRESLPAGERSLLDLVFAWGCAWWLAGGIAEFAQHVATRIEAHAMLGWVGGSVAVAFLLAAALRWARLESVAVVLLPAIVLALAYDLWRGRTSLIAYGWAVYPLAWALHFAILHRVERRSPAANDAASLRKRARIRQWLGAAHLAGALLLLGQIAWEAGEWTARFTPRDTVWPACAHLLPLTLFLLGVRRRESDAPWPLATFAEDYATRAGTLVAVTVGAGFLALALLHPGDARPLPYVPIVNPLELTLALSLAAMYLWARSENRLTAQTLYRALAVGVFLAVNGAVVRAVHHWLGVPWRLTDILASKPLQAALTLTWTATALAAMVLATRRGLRPLWLTGAVLLAAVVVKLFAIDLAALSGLTRVVAFLGVGAMLLVIGYVTPLPPSVAVGSGDNPDKQA